MNLADLVLLLVAEPFRPFRIYLSDGATYSIKHPELAAVGSGTLRLAGATADDPSVPEAETVLIALPHITRIEILVKQVPPSLN